MEWTRTEPEPWRIVDRTDGRGQGTGGASDSNIEHLAGDDEDNELDNGV